MRNHNFRTKRVGVWMALALIALSAAAVWIREGAPAVAFIQNSASMRNEEQITNTGSNLLEDAGSLWKWADPVLKGGSAAAAWTFRWDGAINREQTVMLMARLGLRADEKVAEGVTQAERVTAGGKMLLWQQHSVTDGDEPFVLLYGGQAGQAREDLLAAAAEMESALQASGGSVRRTSFSLRGEPNAGSAIESIAAKADAKLVEQYEDRGTVSAAYYTPYLHNSTASAGEAVNMQLALHRRSGAAGSALIAGVPLITGDYADAN